MGFSDIRKLVEQNQPELVNTIRQALPYRMPKTHLSWDVLSSIIACTTGDFSKVSDQATALHCYLWQIWYQNRFPVYCISNELLRQFQQTDTENLTRLIPPDWTPPVAMFLLALPNNAILSPAGHGCPYILVALHHPDLPPIVKAEHERQITISFADNGEVVWLQGSGLGPDGDILSSHNQLGGSQTDQREHEWLTSVFSLALQSVLALSYLPELVDDEPPKTGTKTLGSSHRPSQERGLQPRWLGRSFERQPSPSHGSHSSPKTHWRKGHWRKQPSGEGRKSQHIVWIRPTLVNEHLLSS
jgi:hypothetical protein